MQQSQPYPNALFYAYLGILIWAPLPHASNVAWAWSLLSILVLLAAALVVITAWWQQDNILGRLAPYKWSIILFFLAPLWVTIQSLPLPVDLVEILSPQAAQNYAATGTDTYYLSLDPLQTRQFALLSWSYWLFFMLTILLVDSPQRMRSLMGTLVLCGLFQALYGSFMTLSGLEYGFFREKNNYLGVATGTFINRNHLAGYLEMCLAIGIGLLVTTLGDKDQISWRQRMRNILDALLGPKIRLRIYLALMVIALVLTRSRMGNAAFFAMLPFCGVLLMILQKRFSKGAAILFASLLAIDFFIVGQWFGFDELAERLQSTSVETETRDEVVRDSWQLVQDYAVSGSGAGTFYTTYPQYRQSDVYGFYDHTHNDYLEFTGDFGLLGFVPLALATLLSLGCGVFAMKQRRDRLAQGVAFAATMGILCLLIHSLVDFNLQMPANALLFILLLALAVIAKNLPREVIKHNRS